MPHEAHFGVFQIRTAFRLHYYPFIKVLQVINPIGYVYADYFIFGRLSSRQPCSDGHNNLV